MYLLAITLEITIKAQNGAYESRFYNRAKSLMTSNFDLLRTSITNKVCFITLERSIWF